MNIADRIERLAEAVEKEEDLINSLSTGEQISVAFVLDRADWLKGYGTILQAMERLGTGWLQAAIEVQGRRQR